MYGPLPIKPKSFLRNCLVSGKCHRLLYISGKQFRILRLPLFLLFNFVNGLAELTVITLFALLFVI